MSIRLKTILGVGLIEAVLLAILIVIILNYMRLTNQENLENYVNTTTTLFATTTKDALLSYDLATLETFVEEILKNQGVLYAKVLDDQQNVVASGGIIELLERPFEQDLDFNDVSDNIFDARTKITVDNHVYGSIQMGISTERIGKLMQETKRIAATIALIEMGLVAMFSFALGVYLTKQLKVLRTSAKKIAAGDLSHKIDIKTHDEVGEVSASFNKMIDSLKIANKKTEEYHQELIELNKSLEDKVQKRTHKIIEQKDKLESAYDQLKTTQKQLVQSEKMASIGQLAAGVAHEINNPVAFVKSNMNSLVKYLNSYQSLIKLQKGFIDDFQDSSKDESNNKLAEISEFWEQEDIDFINEDVSILLNESIEGTHRIQEIVNGLKSYARDSGEELEDCDINLCLEDTLKMLNNELKYACKVTTVFGEIGICKCNKGKIIQVFTNLIVNSIQAMDQKGLLTIKTLLEKDTENGNKILIIISDTGKGIPEENISKLFDPFFTTKPVGEGTGLGLSISLGIIEDHGGSIDIESTVGEGTSFTIRLPA
jgi:signal transduction histidine kinase